MDPNLQAESDTNKQAESAGFEAGQRIFADREVKVHEMHEISQKWLDPHWFRGFMLHPPQDCKDLVFLKAPGADQRMAFRSWYTAHRAQILAQLRAPPPPPDEEAPPPPPDGAYTVEQL
jgi:hypothetical protein